MTSLEDDRRFATDLRALWERYPPTYQRDLARRWADRAIALLADVCSREALAIEAERLANLPSVHERARIVSTALFDLAHGIEVNGAVRKSVDVAILLLAVRAAVEALAGPTLATEALWLACVRRRQAARAARVLDDESRRMVLDLADA